LLPVIALLLGYAFLLFGTSVSGIMLLVALAILLLGFLIALSLREGNDEVILSEPVIPAKAGIQDQEIIVEESIEVEIIDETNVFMR
jgi:hypothetical protein